MDSILGKTILGYEVKEKIGTGGFGDVYKVERNNIVGNVTRALKVITLPKENQYMEILNSMGGDSEKADHYFRQELERVVNEIRVFSMISEKDNHNIVSYYENDVQKVEKYKYNIYILMELLTPLDKWLTMNNLTVEQAIDIGLGVANALKICHENKIMHRDIKLNNIFVSKDGNFKLGDFGVSKRLDSLTRANTIKGTPHYIAPEIYMGNSKYNNSVDIYSLGVLMYYLFNKRRFPFYPDYPSEYTQDDEDRGFYKRMSYETPKQPICAPDEVSKVILKALAKPEERYSRAEEFIADLENAREKLTAEQLGEKIGFEPVDVDKLMAASNKENALVKNLDSSNGASISFEEHTMETLSKKKPITVRKKAIVATVVVLCCLLVGATVMIFNGVGNETKNVGNQVETTTVASGTTGGNVEANHVAETISAINSEETSASVETTQAETTKKAKKKSSKKKEPTTTKQQVTTKAPASVPNNNSSSDGGSEDFNFGNIIE